MGSQKVHFTLSDEALAIIDRRAASPNKRGEWISNALADYDRILSGVSTEDGESGLLEQMSNRLARIEKQLASMIANSGR